jgi:arginase
MPDEAVILVASRDLDPEEALRLGSSPMRVIQLPALRDALDALKRRVAAVYLHLDIDVLDRRISPGVNCMAPGGIAPEELYDSICLIHSKIPIAAATLANFNPDQDHDNRTLKIMLRLAGILGEVLS